MEGNSDSPSGFGNIIQGDLPVLVDMFATWCGPCKMLEPAIKQVAQNMKGTIRVLKIDIDKNPHVAKAYQVMGVPTLILFKKGRIIWRTSGVLPAHEIQKNIEATIKTG